MFGHKKAKQNTKTLMNEGPTIIGMMSVVIESGGSIDTAVRDVAENGPVGSARLFKNVTMDADTRTISDIRTGLTEMLSSLPLNLAAFRRSLHMVIAASDSEDGIETSRMLKDASDISLNGLKDVGNTYSSSLNTPCMIVFALGIMVPMILMSILPMLSIGGLFSSSISMVPVTVITLIVIPCVVVAVIMSIRDRNPFLQTSTDQKVSYFLPMVSAFPLFFLMQQIFGDTVTSIVASVSIAGLLTFGTLFDRMNKEKIRAKKEQYLKDSIFDLGNRLITGDNFEGAITASIDIRKECRQIADSLSIEFQMCRGDVCSAIHHVIDPISSAIADIYCDIYRCSVKDIRDAGRLAISIGRQFQDQDIVRKGIQNKLKSMVDMMTGTAAVFAPLVLGMSITMLGPLASIAEGVDFTNTSLILSVYLVELSILMSVMTCYLTGRTNNKEIAYRMSMMLPISMVVFFLCTNLHF